MRSAAVLGLGDRFENAPRGDRDFANLDAELVQGVVHGVGDRRGRADRAAFADALLSELGIGRRRFHMEHANVGHFRAARQQIVGERRSERLALRVERHFLEQRRADALRGAAVNLAVDDHRIDQHAGVFHHDVVENFDAAGFRIDRDHGGVRRAGVHAGEPLRRIAAGDFEPVGVDIAGQIGRRQVVSPRDVGERNIAARAEHAAVAHLRPNYVGLQHRRADRGDALRQFLAGARGGAAGPDDAARAPGAARIGRVLRVAELDDARWLDRCRDIRCAICVSVVSRPWPMLWMPARTSRRPSGVMRAKACS